MRNWIEGAVALVISVAAIYLFATIHDFVSGWSLMLPGTTDRSLSPEFFPRVAFAILAVVAASVAAVSLRRPDTQSLDQVPPDARIHSPGAAAGWAGLLAAYLLVMWAVGFLIASILLVFALGWLSGYRRIGTLVVFAIIMPTVTELLFSRALSLRLPAGKWLDVTVASLAAGS